MATVSGMATTFDLPQYVGFLFQKAEKPNALLRLIGGLTGAIGFVSAKEFPMGVDYSLPAATQPATVEGADPSPVEQDVTAQATNVVQIFQEAVKLSYSKQGESASIDGLAIDPAKAGEGTSLIVQPGTIAWQLQQGIARVARNANYSFLRGAFQNPANNVTGRKTRGVRTAVTTNAFNEAAAALTKANFEARLKTSLENGMFQQGDTIYGLCDASAYQKLHDLYSGVTSLPMSREVAGVGIKTLVTPWANVNLVWEPDLAAAEIFLTQPQFCRIKALPIPGKGVLFAEPLAQTGAAETWQVYGELGIDYRHEVFHAVITNFT